MTQNKMHLNEAFTDWKTGGGFFASLADVISQNPATAPEWIPDDTRAQILDFQYHGNFSGCKNISRLVENFAEGDPLETADREQIAAMFYAITSANIDRMWNAYKSEYDPIENYSMTETGSDTKTGTDTLTFSGTETNAHTGTQGNSGSSSTSSGIYGYNSQTAVPADTATGTTQNTRTDNLTDTRSFTGRNDSTEYDTETGHTLTRSGNIGTTTSQQMLQSEIELWKWNFYNSFLFPLADSILTIPLY